MVNENSCLQHREYHARIIALERRVDGIEGKLWWAIGLLLTNLGGVIAIFFRT